MLIEHQGRRPTVDPSAWVAPRAVLSGDVPDLTAEAARRYADLFASHREDRVLER